MEYLKKYGSFLLESNGFEQRLYDSAGLKLIENLSIDYCLNIIKMILNKWNIGYISEMSNDEPGDYLISLTKYQISISVYSGDNKKTYIDLNIFGKRKEILKIEDFKLLETLIIEGINSVPKKIKKLLDFFNGHSYSIFYIHDEMLHYFILDNNGDSITVFLNKEREEETFSKKNHDDNWSLYIPLNYSYNKLKKTIQNYI